MLVTKKQIEEILEAFACSDSRVEMRETLVEIDFRAEESRVVKHYEKVHAGDIYVVKLLLLPMSPPQFLQAQAAFSEMYRKEGIPTPRRLPVKKDPGKYIHACQIDGETFIAMAEEWGGEQLTAHTEETIIYMAGLSGKMHAVSEKKDCRSWPGSLYREVCSGRTAYLPLWRQTGSGFLPGDILKETLKRYEIRLKRMRDVWERLPRYTLQGDLYRMNLVGRKGRVQIIDYDRMGDEVLLGDLMSTWFRSWYDEKAWSTPAGTRREELWRRFLTAYEKERTLTNEERQALPDVYAVMGSIYCTRMLVRMAAGGNKKEAGERFGEVLELLKISEDIA